MGLILTDESGQPLQGDAIAACLLFRPVVLNA